VEFRSFLRLRNVVVSFAEFTFDDLLIDEQTLENYKGKYLDIYDKVKSDNAKDKVSILEDIDFELELTRRDEVNVSYILRLIARMVGADEETQAGLKRTIFDTMANTAELRNKRELIERFISGTLPEISEADEVEGKFTEFVSEEQVKQFRQLCEEEGLDNEKTQALLDRYTYNNRPPHDYDIDNILANKPSILERKSIIQRVKVRLVNFIQTFVEGM
jgi:type I restriction enzyme R subunit